MAARAAPQHSLNGQALGQRHGFGCEGACQAGAQPHHHLLDAHTLAGRAHSIHCTEQPAGRQAWQIASPAFGPVPTRALVGPLCACMRAAASGCSRAAPPPPSPCPVPRATPPRATHICFALHSVRPPIMPWRRHASPYRRAARHMCQRPLVHTYGPPSSTPSRMDVSLQSGQSKAEGKSVAVPRLKARSLERGHSSKGGFRRQMQLGGSPMQSLHKLPT